MAGQSQKNALAEVYARSLIELADEQGGLPLAQEAQSELAAVAAAATSDRRFSEFLRSRIITSGVKAATLERMLKGRVSDLTLRFLLVLNKKDRLDQVDAIAHSLQQMLWERTGKVEVEVFTAAPLDSAQTSDVRNRITAAIGRDPVIENTVDPAMIGGIRLRIGDQLIDGSVATRLARMRESLARSGSEAIRTRFASLLA